MPAHIIQQYIERLCHKIIYESPITQQTDRILDKKERRKLRRKKRKEERDKVL